MLFRSIEWYWENGELVVTSNQTTSAPNITPFFNMPFELGYNNVVYRFNQTQPTQTFRIPVATAVTAVIFDPNQGILARGILTKRILPTIPGPQDPTTALDTETNEISIYPNPTNNGQITIKNTKNSALSFSVEIVDILGRKVAEKQIISGENMSFALPKGTYFAKIRNNQNSVVKKIMVQ